MRWVVGVMFAALIVSSALAQTFRPFWFGFGAGGGSITPTTPCGAGQLDFSVATGCNLTWAGH